MSFAFFVVAVSIMPKCGFFLRVVCLLDFCVYMCTRVLRLQSTLVVCFFMCDSIWVLLSSSSSSLSLLLLTMPLLLLLFRRSDMLFCYYHGSKLLKFSK